VLFVCVHNSGRSQMAEAIFNHIGGKKLFATSAGTRPAYRVNPIAVKIMREWGLDISQYQPKQLTLEMMENADRVIAMGCNMDETCPAAVSPMEDWEIEDPEGKTPEKVREIRDIITKKVENLIRELYMETQLELKGGER